MKDKTPLLLIEQLIMILVFALTAALCLRGFAYADGLSEQIYQQEQAAVLAQSAAETLKAEKEIRQACSFYDASLEQVTEKRAGMPAFTSPGLLMVTKELSTDVFKEGRALTAEE